MRLRIIAVLALISGAFFVVSQQSAYAAEPSTISPEVINRVKARCIENQGTLNRLHKTDAFIRIDRGSLYQTIGDKLMVPLNRRLASNQLDPGKLLTITSDYKAEYDEFYQAYIDYDNALSRVLDIDCTREPVTFYNALIEARSKRAELSASIGRLKAQIRDYGVNFTDFKTKYENGQQE